MDEGQVVGRELVVARRDPPTLFDLIEESFDQSARSVEIRTKADRLGAIASRRYVGPSVPLRNECSDPIGVITAVRKQRPRRAAARRAFLTAFGKPFF